jgi:hypothetical protein
MKKFNTRSPFEPVTRLSAIYIDETPTGGEGNGLSPGRCGSSGICEADWLTQSFHRVSGVTDVGQGAGTACGSGTILSTYTDEVVVGSGSGVRHSAGDIRGCGGSSLNPEPARLGETL